VFDQMMPWIQEQCVPLVREITFANGEVGTVLLKTCAVVSLPHLFINSSSENKAPSLNVLYHCLLFLPFSSFPLVLYLLLHLLHLLPSTSQELTEEGLPLLLLFYSPDDTSTKDLFKQRVEAELLDQKGVELISV